MNRPNLLMLGTSVACLLLASCEAPPPAAPIEEGETDRATRPVPEIPAKEPLKTEAKETSMPDRSTTTPPDPVRPGEGKPQPTPPVPSRVQPPAEVDPPHVYPGDEVPK